jgi:RNA polymerase sigma-70 factor (ECF subfamily)
MMAKPDDRREPIRAAEQLEELFRSHYPAVVSYVRRRAPAETVDDIVADTFMVAWRRLERVPADSLPWLLAVAGNVIATQRRATVRRRALLLRLRSAAVETVESGHVEEVGPVHVALLGLSEKDREALTLIAWDGLRPTQAATVLGESPGTFRVRLHRVRRRPSVAFADWRAHPTVAAGGQVRATESECQRNSKLTSISPTLAETRGPYTLLIYAENPGGLCVTGPSMLSPTGEPVVASLHAVALTTPVAGDAIKRIDNASVTAKASPSSAALSFNDGRVGAHVTAVTLVLTDGSRVQATVANGWFAAWWPGGQAAQTAEITTTAGTATQQLVPPPGYETSAPAVTTGTR